MSNANLNVSWGDAPAAQTMLAKSGVQSPAAERLTKMKASLGTLHQSIRTDVESRKAQEEARINEVRELATKVDKHLQLEVKRRTDADKTLQHMFETRLKDIADNIEKGYAAKLDDMRQNVDILTKKVVSLEKEIVSERERTARLASELRHASTNSVADVKAALEQEKATRLERETQILKKIAEDTHQTQERVEMEKTARVEAVEALRDEITKQMKTTERIAEKFRSKTMDDMDCVKAAIRVEAQTRESAEENLAHTMDVITNQFQSAMALLSK
jgi:hypothetical protein